MNGNSQLVFGLIVEGFGQDHLAAVWEFNLEIFCIRLPNAHRYK